MSSWNPGIPSPRHAPSGDPLAPAAGAAFFWKGVQLAGAKLIFLARTLILARLLAPADFGLLAVSPIDLDLLMRVTDLGMVPAVVQRPHPEPAHYQTAWTIEMVRGLGVFLVVFAFAPALASLFAEPRAADLIRVAALRPLLESAASINFAKRSAASTRPFAACTKTRCSMRRWRSRVPPSPPTGAGTATASIPPPSVPQPVNTVSRPALAS